MSALPLSNELCDSLRALSLKKRQGVLEILAPDHEYELTFLEGRIIHADQLDRPLWKYLFEKMSKDDLALLDENKLKEANKADLFTGIIEGTKFSVSNLIEFKHEYDRRTLNLLAAERSLSFDFRTKIVRCPEGLSLDLAPGHYLLDLIESAENEALSSPASMKVIQPETSKTTAAEQLQQPLVQPTVQPNVVVPRASRVSKKNKNRSKGKSKRPPRVGRWKGTKKRRRRQQELQLSGEKLFLGVKLILFLTLVIFAPNFLNDWVTKLIDFSLVQ